MSALLIARETVAAGTGEGPARRPPSSEASIAVLPFRNRRAEPDERVTSAKGSRKSSSRPSPRLKTLRVAARTSTFTFKGKDVDIARNRRAVEGERRARRQRAHGRRSAARRLPAHQRRRMAPRSGPSATIASWPTSSPSRTTSRARSSTTEGVACGASSTASPRTENRAAYHHYLKGRFHSGASATKAG